MDAKLKWSLIGYPVMKILEGVERFTLDDRFYRRIALIWYASVYAMIFAGYHAIPTPVTVSGFWSGVWHGLIAWPALLISVFSDSVSVYSSSNNGWYNWGFLSGVSLSISLPYQRQVMKWRHKTGGS